MAPSRRTGACNIVHGPASTSIDRGAGLPNLPCVTVGVRNLRVCGVVVVCGLVRLVLCWFSHGITLQSVDEDGLDSGNGLVSATALDLAIHGKEHDMSVVHDLSMRESVNKVVVPGKVGAACCFRSVSKLSRIL